MSSQNLISTRWMSRRVLLRFLGRCCLGLVAVLVAGGAASLPQFPPATLRSPPPYISLLLSCFCSDGSNQHKIWAAGGESVFIWEAGWEEPSGNNSTFGCFRNLEIFLVIRSLLPISMETTHDPKEPVLLIALKIMRHAKLCLLVIMFLTCVCWHPERMRRALSTCGQRGQV